MFDSLRRFKTPSTKTSRVAVETLPPAHHPPSNQKRTLVDRMCVCVSACALERFVT